LKNNQQAKQIETKEGAKQNLKRQDRERKQQKYPKKKQEEANSTLEASRFSFGPCVSVMHLLPSLTAAKRRG
jgi:hypothetical protein